MQQCPFGSVFQGLKPNVGRHPFVVPDHEGLSRCFLLPEVQVEEIWKGRCSYSRAGLETMEFSANGLECKRQEPWKASGGSIKVTKVMHTRYQGLQVRIVFERGECGLTGYQDRLHVVDMADLTTSLCFTQEA